MDRSRLFVLILLIVLSSCNTGVTPTRTQSPSPTAETLTVYGEFNGTDPTTVWNRVQRMHRSSVSPPVVYFISRNRSCVRPTRFQRALGLASAGARHCGSKPNGYVPPGDRQVYVIPGTARPGQVEYVLAHEFAHSIQNARNLDRIRRENGRLANERLVFRLVAEGGAEYVEHRYAREYLPQVDRRTTAERYRAASLFAKYHIAPYYYGERYVRSRVDSPSDLDEVYADPPETTEQVLHPGKADNEPPEAMNTTVRTESAGCTVDGDVETKGELFVRIVLRSELNAPRAVEAATGWDGDQLFVIRDADDARNNSYLWVLRWDNETEADEFETAVDSFARQRNDKLSELTVRHRRLNDREILVYVGEPGFAEHVRRAGRQVIYRC